MMIESTFVSPDSIRTAFAQAMSDMYKEEVPQYGTLLDLVSEVNEAVLASDEAVRSGLERTGDLDRINLERHGAIRLGAPAELAMIRRIFAVMGMHAVGYYDLSVAGVPVHATAFRPISDEALRNNPFRVFTSLLRLDLIDDMPLRELAASILERRRIFTDDAVDLVKIQERDGGLTPDQAGRFVDEVLTTFRWHREATVDVATYHRLLEAHRLIADVVCFKGPHINHLTPRTMDIDAAQARMLARGLEAKEVIEGPPRRRCPILLRQTSFKALEELIEFVGEAERCQGTHKARFGEIEQRGVALTRQGRARYDQLLERVRGMDGTGSTSSDYAQRLEQAFSKLPDDEIALDAADLAFYRYVVQDLQQFTANARSGEPFDLAHLISLGAVGLAPIVYEDFLPVSAAGIFQSNLGGTEQKAFESHAAQSAFEAALGQSVLDEFAIYEQSRKASLDLLRSQYAALRLPG